PPGEKDPARRAQIEGRQLVAQFDFGDGGSEPLLAKLAISPVSEDGAIANLEAEVPHWDFDRVRATAEQSWREALSAVEAEGSREQRAGFYTALYHAMLGPTLFMDVD